MSVRILPENRTDPQMFVTDRVHEFSVGLLMLCLDPISICIHCVPKLCAN